MSFVEFRIFDGVSGELRPWLSWLEDFFVQENFTADEKLNLAQSLLAGEAESWFYRRQKTIIFQSWEELKDSLLLLFGDFADSDRIRLIAKRDRLLQEIREEARILRMKTTSIPVTVAGASCEKDESHEDTTREEVSITQNQDGGASFAKELITQCQVPNSSLEPSLSFSSEPLDVSASWPCVIVSNNPVDSQFGFESVKITTNAHQVLDEMLRRRHKSQQRKKPSLSPKSRMFKFKNRNMLSNWSQMDLQQVIDISNVTNSYPCFNVVFGLLRKKRTVQCLRLQNLRLHKQAHLSRFLYPMRMLHDPGGMTQLLHGVMQSMFVCVREFARLLEVVCVLAACMMHKATVISAKLPETIRGIELVTDSGQLKAVLVHIIQGKDEAYTKIIDKLQIKLKQGMDLLGASWHCSTDKMNQFHSPIGLVDDTLVDALHFGLGENVHTLLAAVVHESAPGQLKSSSIWHRWRRKD